MNVTRSAVTWCIGVLIAAVAASYLGWSITYERSHPAHDLLTTPPPPVVSPEIVGVVVLATGLLLERLLSRRA